MMITCLEATELISRSMDSALPSIQIAQIEDHMSGCPGCSRFMKQVHIMRTFLKKYSSAVTEGIPLNGKDHLPQDRKQKIKELFDF